MEPGVYEYPFDFTLPCDLPTSFEDAWGYVRYNAHFVLKTPFVDANCVKPFKVIKPIDLNHVPKLRVIQSFFSLVSFLLYYSFLCYYC